MCHQDMLNTARTYEASLQVAVEPERLHQIWPPPHESKLVRTHAEALPFFEPLFTTFSTWDSLHFGPKNPSPIHLVVAVILLKSIMAH